jgi:hypothetical protein
MQSFLTLPRTDALGGPGRGQRSDNKQRRSARGRERGLEWEVGVRVLIGSAGDLASEAHGRELGMPVVRDLLRHGRRLEQRRIDSFNSRSRPPISQS